MAWIAWLMVHIFFLIGFRNRLSVFGQWAWTYLTLRDGWGAADYGVAGFAGVEGPGLMSCGFARSEEDGMEATEMQEFSEKMKESGEESLTTISLAISSLAVLVAMVTVLGHRSHTEAVLMQSRAGDQWNEYQAKKIRQDNLQVDVDMLELQPMVDVKATQAKLAEYTAHIAKWDKDLVEEEAKAREFENEGARVEAQANRFDLGEALLQTSVVLSSITLFTRRRHYFFGGICLGAAGLLVAASAWLVK
jgi:hypothetical protein